MSSRVQKGGTLFRPVAKTRGRQSAEPSSQPASDNVNNPLKNAPVPPLIEPSISMPPPSFIPRHPTPSLSTPSENHRTDSAMPIHTSPVPPKIHHTSATTESTVSGASPSRRGPTPLVIGQSRKRAASRAPAEHSGEKNSVLHPLTNSESFTATPAVDTGSSSPEYIQAPSFEVTDSISMESVSQMINHEDIPPTDASQREQSEPPAKRLRPARSKNKKQDSPDISETSMRKIIRRASTWRNNRNESEDPPNDSGSERTTTKKRLKLRSSTSSTKSRKSTKGSSLPPYDPGTPGPELDPTAVTMAILCKDTGQGRVSSKATEIMNNHLAWKAANREKRARMISIMEAKKYGRNLEEEEEEANKSSTSKVAESNKRAETPSSSLPAEIPSYEDALPEDFDVPAPATSPKAIDFDYSQSMSTSKFNAQVRIRPNGETVIDEDSLFVDTNAEQDMAEYTHVEESDTTKFINSATHSKKYRGSRWTVEETELFFTALSQFGENYELISYVLPGRDRKACKNKFKAEDKKNPERINRSLKNRLPYDIQTLSRLTGKDFSGPTPMIRIPTPVLMAENDHHVDGEDENRNSPVVRKQSRTPGIGQSDQNVEEVLGDLYNFEDKDTT